MTRRAPVTLICLMLGLFMPGTVWAKDAFTTYGDVGKIAIPAAGAAFAFAIGDSDGLKQLFVSSAATVGATYALKYTVNETRPNGGAHSFPSGHSSFAFAGAAFVHERYGWKWGIPFEVAAAAVAYSRVDARKHYWYDVVASAGLAHLSAYFLVDHRDTSVAFFPVGPGKKPGLGIMSSVRF